MSLLEIRKFSELDIQDPFFSSLKEDYKEFSMWFKYKADKGESAYVFTSEITQKIDGFLYLKLENEPVNDVVLPFSHAKRVKVGTFKVNAHGTRLDERLLKKVFDHALENEVNEIYVTLFPKHAGLLSLFTRYGFNTSASKISGNGKEIVLRKTLNVASVDPVTNYPTVLKSSRKRLLGIYPQYHTRLFPDSKLITDSVDIIKDVSHTNSIHKIYICDMNGVSGLRRGDTLLIYRTKDKSGPARFRSVATSICVVEEYRPLSSFSTLSDYLNYTLSYSVFSKEELERFYREGKPKHCIRFTYNYAFKKRPNRDRLIDECGFPEGGYYGFFHLKDALFYQAVAASTSVPGNLFR